MLTPALQRPLQTKNSLHEGHFLTGWYGTEPTIFGIGLFFFLFRRSIHLPMTWNTTSKIISMCRPLCKLTLRGHDRALRDWPHIA